MQVNSKKQKARAAAAGRSALPGAVLLGAWMLLALAGGLARAAGEENELVTEFRRFYTPKRSVTERIEAVLVLKDVDTLGATQALAEVFDDEDFQVRRTAVETIGTYRGADSIQFLVETFIANKREKKLHRLACAAEALGRMKAAAAAAPLAELFDRARDWELRRAIALALADIGADEGVPVLLELLADRDPTLRVVALDGLGTLNKPALTQDRIFAVMAGDDNWQVRAAAIEAVLRMRTKESIQPLIDRMREETGRLRGDAFAALREITFCTFDDDPDQWQRFWDRARETWELPDYEKVMAERERREREGTRYNKPAAQFLGIPTKSKRIIFVIDVSGSMEAQVIEVERFRASGRSYDSFQKLDIVKAELIATVEALEDGVEFNIIAFAKDVNWWKKRLVPCNVLNRNSAVEFVKDLKPLGGALATFRTRAGLGGASAEEGKTNTFGALMAALGAPEEESAEGYDRNLKHDVDTIYFLSDGAPTVGRLIDPEEIRAEVRRVNAVRRVVLHTIAIGDFRKNFMKALAKDNGGVYVDLGK